jgi:hypothetical protein
MGHVTQNNPRSRRKQNADCKKLYCSESTAIFAAISVTDSASNMYEALPERRSIPISKAPSQDGTLCYEVRPSIMH